jgi:diguanylate cyclase (GGDEF)-like protein
MTERRDTIWLIDDAEIIHKAVKVVLEGYDFHSFFSGEEFLDFIGKGDYKFPDLILLDIIMGKITGFEVLEKLMENMEFREIPVIILSTKESIEDKVKGLEMGATDYIVKPFYEKELSARVRVHVKIKKNQDALRKKVILDFLTNSFNKRHLFTRLKTHFSVYHRHGEPVSLIFFDIDYFKEINDNFGHVTGDFVLKEMCSEIKAGIRSEDELFRYGGEEFVILAPFTSKTNAGKIAEKIRERIIEKKFIYHDEEIRITLSLGVASIPDDDVKDLTALVELADKRMFMAKKNGRNQVVIEGPSVPADVK